MKRAIAGTILMNCAGWLAWGQPSEGRPKFEAADVHVSAKATNPFARSGARGGRYEVKTATMVDLIRIAYGFDADKIVGGPSWLEMDRFDVIGKIPPDTDAETQKLMLQSALEDRFKLVVHKDIKPMPTYALTAGKKLQMKEASGSEEPGCKPGAAAGPPGEGGGISRLTMMNATGPATTISLGPGMTVQYACRNMSMAAFVGGLRGMIGAITGPNAILDETGLKGNWNFDLKYSIQFMGPMGANASDRISIFEAVDKQMGLKLEEKQVPTPVMAVDSVNQKPSENPPGVAEALPPIPAPTEFEVATIKLAEGDIRMSRYMMQPGGRLVAEGMPLRFLISRAFNSNNNDEIVGLPAFVQTDRYEVTAKAPGQSGPGMDNDVIAPMMRALLVDRFKMKYHTEERPMTAYSLVAGKSKMKKADPASRTFCKNGTAPPGSPPGSRLLTCQNATMAQFAEKLQNIGPDLSWPVLDATGIEGGWDFTLIFSSGPQMAMMAAGGGRGSPEGGQPAAAGVATASDPVGGYTVFEAVEKQLGLKLEKQKRSLPVIVIDHIEQRPTEN